jgi:hypothetical protein
MFAPIPARVIGHMILLCEAIGRSSSPDPRSIWAAIECFWTLISRREVGSRNQSVAHRSTMQNEIEPDYAGSITGTQQAIKPSAFYTRPLTAGFYFDPTPNHNLKLGVKISGLCFKMHQYNLHYSCYISCKQSRLKGSFMWKCTLVIGSPSRCSCAISSTVWLVKLLSSCFLSAAETLL